MVLYKILYTILTEINPFHICVIEPPCLGHCTEYFPLPPQTCNTFTVISSSLPASVDFCQKEKKESAHYPHWRITRTENKRKLYRLVWELTNLNEMKAVQTVTFSLMRWVFLYYFYPCQYFVHTRGDKYIWYCLPLIMRPHELNRSLTRDTFLSQVLVGLKNRLKRENTL